MQQALPYKTWLPTTPTSGGSAATALQSSPHDNPNPSRSDDVSSNEKNVQKMVSESAVIVFGRRGCCMCHVIKHLLQGHGVNPTISYVDEQEEADLLDQLSRIASASEEKAVRPQFPAIFVGGKLLGGLERVMATHISGELVPILKEAGALWL